MAVTYNGISFAFARTEVNVAGPGMDKANADQLYTVIRLKVRGIINMQVYPAVSVSQLAGLTDPSQVLAYIRHKLTAPRKPLYYDLNSLPGQRGGSPIIDIPTGRDDANGPIPDPDAFSAVYTTEKTIEVTWAVTVKLRDCRAGGGDANVPLSLRWEDSIEFDKYWKATYKRQGTLVLSSLSNVSIDTWRRYGLAPSVAPGFAREQASYAISSDGLRCDFQFVDGQIRYAPPAPIVDMDITQSESLPTLDGMKFGEVVVNLRGVIDALPTTLQDWAFEISFARMNAAHPLATEGRAIAEVLFSTRETKDSIEASCAIKYRIPPNQNAQTVIRNKGAAWGAIIGGAAAGLRYGIRGGLIGAAIGTGVGAIVGGLTAPSAEGQPTKEGRPTTRHPFLPWVGFGTGAPQPEFPTGYARWANPYGSINGPTSGIGLAGAVGLYAALLADPCGGAVPPTAEGQTQIITSVPFSPEAWNTAEAGQGGTTQMATATLAAGVTHLRSTQYPTTVVGSDNSGLFQWDGEPGAYDLWQCANEYFENPGTLVAPTSDPDGVSVKIRYASTQLILRRRWVAGRTGAPPRLPPRTPPSDNWVLTAASDTVRDMRVAPDGVSVVYECSGVYEYMALDPNLVTLTAEVPPYISETALTSIRAWVSALRDSILRGGPTLGGMNPLGSGSLPVPPPN